MWTTTAKSIIIASVLYASAQKSLSIKLNPILIHYFKGVIMNLSAPTKIVFYISLILGVLGVLAAVVEIPFLSGISFLLVVVAWVLLALGALLPKF